MRGGLSLSVPFSIRFSDTSCCFSRAAASRSTTLPRKGLIDSCTWCNTPFRSRVLAACARSTNLSFMVTLSKHIDLLIYGKCPHFQPHDLAASSCTNGLLYLSLSFAAVTFLQSGTQIHSRLKGGVSTFLFISISNYFRTLEG